MSLVRPIAVGVVTSAVVLGSALLLSRPTLPVESIETVSVAHAPSWARGEPEQRTFAVLKGAHQGRPAHTTEARLYWAAEDGQQPEAWWQLCIYRLSVGATAGAIRNSCGRYVELAPKGEHAAEARRRLQELPQQQGDVL